MHLTPRERTICELVAHRWTTKRIARALNLSTRTVQIYLSSVAFKIHVPAGEDDRQAVADWWRSQASDEAKSA